jgi:hypothetical protein
VAVGVPDFVLKYIKCLHFAANCNLFYKNAERVFVGCTDLTNLTIECQDDNVMNAFFDNVLPLLEEVQLPIAYKFRLGSLHDLLSRKTPRLRRFVALPEIFPLQTVPFNFQLAPATDLGESLVEFASEDVKAISMSADMTITLCKKGKVSALDTITDLCVYPSYNDSFSEVLGVLPSFSNLVSLMFYCWPEPFNGPFPPNLESLSFVFCILNNYMPDCSTIPKKLTSFELVETEIPEESVAMFMQPTLTKLVLTNQEIGPWLYMAISKNLPALQKFTWKSEEDQFIFPSLRSSMNSMRELVIEKNFGTATPYILIEDFCAEMVEMPNLVSLTLNGFVHVPQFIMDYLLTVMCRVTTLNIIGTDIEFTHRHQQLVGSAVRHLTVSPQTMWSLCVWPLFFPHLEILGCRVGGGVKFHKIIRFIRAVRKGIIFQNL